MRVGFVGLGKLGLPVATAMALRGADVMGYDVDARRMSYAPQPYKEAGPDGTGDFNNVLRGISIIETVNQVGSAMGGERAKGSLRFGSLAEVVAHAEVLFLAVQTPHDERFGGDKPVRDAPCDFDYSHLVRAVEMVVEAKADHRPLPLAVISTVLPGTMAREVKPRLSKGLLLCYNPHFIAMGTTMRDFLNPEFVLLGVDDSWAAEVVEGLYKKILANDRGIIPGYRLVQKMSVASAELTKVAYNTYISTKIAVANTLMEICHKTPGANVDEVTRALKQATKRVASGMYMDGGMGDGGGCHPRDNIALWWLADEMRLSHNPFKVAMEAREAQSRWLRDLLIHEYIRAKASRMIVAGYAFKPGTNITAGSPALLLAAQVRENGYLCETWDPHVNGRREKRDPPDAFPLTTDSRVAVLIGCRHPEFEGWDGGSLAPGSVVIDPHRTTGPAAKGIRIVRLGEGRVE